MSKETTPRRQTKRMLEFLQWARAEGHYKIWPIEWSVMHRKARAAGYIERCRDIGSFGLTSYRISDQGREVMRAGR